MTRLCHDTVNSSERPTHYDRFAMKCDSPLKAILEVARGPNKLY